jgi:hypothetical protein
MVHKPIAISVIAPVAVAAVLMLAILATISLTNQAFAYSSYHKGHHSPGYYKSPGRTYTKPHTSSGIGGKSPGRAE